MVTGCVGVIDRDDFDLVVESRGGGFSNDLVADAAELVAERVGTDDLELTNLVVNPGSRLVVLTVRDPVVRENVDRYTLTGRDGIRDVSPVRVRADEDLDADTYRLSDIPALDDLEALSDAALEALSLDEGHIESIQVLVVMGAPQVHVSVESPRAGGRVIFAPDGTVQGARRS